MRHIFRLFRPVSTKQHKPWTLSEEQHKQVMQLLSRIGLDIVAETRGPVPLMKFSRKVLDRLETRMRPDPVALEDFAAALKVVIRDMDHPQLRLMSPTDFPGVGYVFDALDRETWPIQTSR